MLDTGTLYDMATSGKIPEWTSRTWKIDWDKKRLLSKRIGGKEAVAQASTVALHTDYLKHPIFSDRFGSEFDKYIGGDRSLLKANAERLVKECLSPDLRIDRVTDFKKEDIDKNSLHISFVLELNGDLIDDDIGDGRVEMEMEVPYE